MTKVLRLGVLGLGTVGTGLLKVLAKNSAEIERRTGVKLVVTRAAVQSLCKVRPPEAKNMVVTDHPLEVVVAPDVDVVVELIGGDRVAKTCVEDAIAHGKPVITANKMLLAEHGNELFAQAEKAGVPLLYEAAVAGGIPIIKALREGLLANEIEWVAGIINGTSNFVLSLMQETGCSFEQALQEAQAQGYAEADPSMDIAGIDAAHKICLVAANAFGTKLTFNEVYLRGISGITAEDVAYAKELGYVIKPLAVARKSAQGVSMRVQPALVAEECPLATVAGVNNALMVHGNAVGSTMYYGAGAGGEATASAVLSDIIDVVRHGKHLAKAVPYLACPESAQVEVNYLPPASDEATYYLRLRAKDRPGVLADITRVLGDAGISIETIVQKADAMDDDYMPVVILTHPVVEETLTNTLKAMQSIHGVKERVLQLPVAAFSSTLVSPVTGTTH